jgi:energy-coupling factor transporter ATP-binding protein EcfA2
VPDRIATNIEDLAGIDLDPLLPGDERYQDIALLRGGDPIRRAARKLTLAERGAGGSTLLLGHRGSGRTTELLRLRGLVEPKFLCVDVSLRLASEGRVWAGAVLMGALTRITTRADTNEDLSALQVELSRRLTSLLSNAGFLEGVRVASPSGLRMPGTQFVPLERRLAAAGERSSVRAILDEVRGLLDFADVELYRLTGRQLLILVDDVDGLNEPAMRELVEELDAVLAHRGVPLVMTGPIWLAYESWLHRLSVDVALLPALTLRHRQEAYEHVSPGALSGVAELLARRFSPELISPAALAYLAFASGGNLRELLLLLREAALEETGSSVSVGSLQTGARRRRESLWVAAQVNGWTEELVTVAGRKEIVPSSDWRRLLELGLVSAQRNGESWHDVHPLVGTHPAFAAELQRRATAMVSTETQLSPLPTGIAPVAPRVESLRLLGISFVDFRGLERLEIAFSSTSALPGRWLCLAGVNGAGKSAALQGIALALLGEDLVKELGRERLARMVRRTGDGRSQERAELRVELRLSGATTASVSALLSVDTVFGLKASISRTLLRGDSPGDIQLLANGVALSNASTLADAGVTASTRLLVLRG